MTEESTELIRVRGQLDVANAQISRVKGHYQHRIATLRRRIETLEEDLQASEVPLPYRHGMRWQCGACGHRYWTWPGYRGHYALVHILGRSETFTWAKDEHDG